MTKLFLISLCLCIVYINAENVSQCTLSSGQVIKVGESEPEKGTCNIVTCHPNGSITGKTCPEFQVPSHCTRVKGDSNKLFPYCCDYGKCPDKH